MSQDTINRNVYGRLFRGSHDAESDTGPWALLGSIFDKTYMPALLVDSGHQIYYKFSADAGDSLGIPLPANYDRTQRIYVAVKCNKKAKLTFIRIQATTTQNALLMGTDSSTEGVHPGLWTYQGRLFSLTVVIPSSMDGGAATDVEVFMYQIPDLEDFESYYDKQIGLGVSGSE